LLDELHDLLPRATGTDPVQPGAMFGKADQPGYPMTGGAALFYEQIQASGHLRHHLLIVSQLSRAAPKVALSTAGLQALPSLVVGVQVQHSVRGIAINAVGAASCQPLRISSMAVDTAHPLQGKGTVQGRVSLKRGGVGPGQGHSQVAGDAAFLATPSFA
jgi:hypothetical protein